MNPVRTYYVKKPKEEDKKNFELKKNSKINFFSTASDSFLPFIPLYLQIYI